MILATYEVLFISECSNANNSASGTLESADEDHDSMSAAEDSSESNDCSSENERLSSGDDEDDTDTNMDCDDAESCNSNGDNGSIDFKKTSVRSKRKKVLTAEKLAKIHQEEVCPL
jgi:hypothetical protein